MSGNYSGITSVGNLTNLNVIGIASATGYTGDGANLTNLNATNLASGTVPSARVSGSYSGITSVGTLSQLIVTGISTLTSASISSFLLDFAGRPGFANSVLTSIGTAVLWSASAGGGSGTIGGSISATQIAFGASPNNIQGVGTFIFRNGSLGIGTTTPRVSLETTDEIYVDRIYIGAGNSFTNIIIGYGATDGGANAGDSIIIGYNANIDPPNATKGVLIGNNNSKNNDFFFTGKTYESLIFRPKEYQDGALPSATGMMVSGLVRLGKLNGNALYLEKAEKVLTSYSSFITRAPLASGQFLLALELLNNKSKELVLVSGTEEESEKEKKPEACGSDAHDHLDVEDPLRHSKLQRERHGEHERAAERHDHHELVA